MNPRRSDSAAESGGPGSALPAGRLSTWIWVAGAMTLLKLWLTSGQTLYAIGGADHDDRLALNLAAALLRGEWLGSYNHLTLAKGPFYSLWIAGVFLLGIPLMQAQQLLGAGACVLAVRALAPVVKSGWGKLGIYSLLLWNPMSFDAGGLGRVLRQDIYPHLTLMLFAAMIALYVRRAAPWRRLAPWAATLGLTWAAFWLNREESIWIVPSLILLGAAYVIGAGRHSRPALVNTSRVAVIAALGALAPILTVCALNARHYGWFGTVEFRAAAFKDAYGALLRVRPEEEIPFVPVTRATRERIYAVSPAFAELKPYLEGDIGRDWATISSPLTHCRPEEQEIGGGWFMWALRQAVEAAGHGHDARAALRFYAQIAREVNQACDRGTLPAGPHRSGFVPPWQEGQIAALPRTLLDFGWYLISFDDFTAGAPGSMGSAAELDYFRDLTRMRLSRPTEALGYEYALPNQQQLDTWKVETLRAAGEILRKVFCALILIAHLVVIIRAVQLALRRELTYPVVLAVAAWIGCAACLLVCALVQVTSFPTRSQVYFAPAYPLLLLFVAAVMLDAVRAGCRGPGREIARAAVVPTG